MTTLSNPKWPSGVAIAVAVACTAAPPPRPSETARDAPPLPTTVVVAEADAGTDAMDAKAPEPALEECAVAPPLDDAKGCEVFAKMNRRALQGIKPISDAGAGGFDPQAGPGLCFGTPNGGAWGILLRNPKQTGTPGSGNEALSADWFIAHADAKGSVTFAKGPSKYMASSFGGTTFGGLNNQSAVFDYDGDGEAELVLVHGTSEHTGSGNYTAAIYAFTKGKVSLYANAPDENIVGASDIDCDGRPDLTFVAPFDGTTNCTSVHHMSALGPRLGAHSLPDGSFSLTDAVARAKARSECSERPRAFDESLLEDETDLLWSVRCARLWGVPAPELEKRIRMLCKPPGPDDSCLSRSPGVCVLFDLVLEWIRATPPITLP